MVKLVCFLHNCDVSNALNLISNVYTINYPNKQNLHLPYHKQLHRDRWRQGLFTLLEMSASPAIEQKHENISVEQSKYGYYVRDIMNYKIK
jgi:hypothetical protein